MKTSPLIVRRLPSPHQKKQNSSNKNGFLDDKFKAKLFCFLFNLITSLVLLFWRCDFHSAPRWLLAFCSLAVNSSTRHSARRCSNVLTINFSLGGEKPQQSSRSNCCSTRDLIGLCLMAEQGLGGPLKNHRMAFFSFLFHESSDPDI